MATPPALASTAWTRRAVLAAGLCAPAAACGSGPQGFLTPTPTPPPPSASVVDMLVVTTRNPSPQPGVIFGGERDPGHSISEILVSVPPDASRAVGSIQWPGKGPADPAKSFATLAVRPSDPAASAEWFLRVAGPSGRLLLFVHGYNTRFETAVYRFAQISHDSDAQAAPVLFTWPSRGHLLDYVYDRDSANFSRDALEQAIEKAADSPHVREVVILAHSMGAYLAMEALRQTAIRRGRLPDKIHNIILASPDLDPQVFSRQVSTFGAQRPHITIFVARDDRALAISRFLAGRMRRLGAIDPSQEPYRSRLESAGDVTVIDLSAYKSGDRLNHGRFAESPEIVRLIGRNLVNGQVSLDGP